MRITDPDAPSTTSISPRSSSRSSARAVKGYAPILHTVDIPAVEMQQRRRRRLPHLAPRQQLNLHGQLGTPARCPAAQNIRIGFVSRHRQCRQFGTVMRAPVTHLDGIALDGVAAAALGRLVHNKHQDTVPGDTAYGERRRRHGLDDARHILQGHLVAARYDRCGKGRAHHISEKWSHTAKVLKNIARATSEAAAAKPKLPPGVKLFRLRQHGKWVFQLLFCNFEAAKTQTSNNIHTYA